MRELAEKELYQALAFAKNQDEDSGRKILEQFQREQPALAQSIFGVFSAVIAQKDQHVAHLFMDLCFDVICVFKHAFGTLPNQQSMGFEWLEKSAALLDTEMQSFMTQPMDSKIRNKLQNRFTERLVESDNQTGLVDFMNASIDELAIEAPTSSKEAIQMAKTMIFVVIQLFGAVYDQANNAKQ